MQIGFFFDQSRCIGCNTCVVACKDWHDIQPGPVSWLRITSNEKGCFPVLSLSYLFNPCFHCADPPCVESCPVDAIEKRDDNGIVVVDQDACTGCRLCLDSCPYDVPQFDDTKKSKMQKCNFCLERWMENKKPICVQACPVRALDAGPIDELESKYGSSRKAEDFNYDKSQDPSVIFRVKSKNDM